MSSCLVILNPGAEETETMAVADVLVRGGIAVTIAASELPEQGPLRGSRNLPMAADLLLSEVDPSSFDVMYLPGGIGSAEYARDSQKIQRLLQEQLASPRILAIICASPIALVPLGLATGKQLTSHPSVRETLETAGAIWRGETVVWDHNLVTSQGPGTAIALGLSLVERLVDTASAEKIANAMLVPWKAS